MNSIAAGSLFAVLGTICLAASPDTGTSFIGPLHRIKANASTVPQNGDVNPYGVAVIPATVGNLQRGNVLVSISTARRISKGPEPPFSRFGPALVVRDCSRR